MNKAYNKKQWRQLSKRRYDKKHAEYSATFNVNIIIPKVKTMRFNLSPSLKKLFSA